MDLKPETDQRPLRAVNAFLAGALGVLAGAAASLVFVNSLCPHNNADSMCGTMIILIGPAWAIGTGIACAVIAAAVPVPPDISSASWAGAVIGAAFAIAAGVPALGSFLRHGEAGTGNVSPQQLRQVELLVTFAMPLLLSAAATLGGLGGRAIRKTAMVSKSRSG